MPDMHLLPHLFLSSELRGRYCHHFYVMVGEAQAVEVIHPIPVI